MCMQCKLVWTLLITVVKCMQIHLHIVSHTIVHTLHSQWTVSNCICIATYVVVVTRLEST